MFLAVYITSVTTWASATIQSKAAKLHSGMKDVTILLLARFRNYVQYSLVSLTRGEKNLNKT